jgi:hypothetical protein
LSKRRWTPAWNRCCAHKNAYPLDPSRRSGPAAHQRLPQKPSALPAGDHLQSVIIIRHMFEGARPLDWLMLVVEALVLALIAYEIVSPRWHRRKIRRLLNVAFDFVQRGQKLQAISPQGIYGPEGPHGPQFVPAWIEKVKTWNQEALDFMERCSPQARASFLSDTSSGAAHTQQSLMVPPEAQWWYRTMLTRLDNLQRIAENPDVYF